MTKVMSSHRDHAAGAPSESMALFPENSGNHAVPGSLNDDLMVREVITNAIKRSTKSREEIAEEMSRLLAVSVTERMITAFTSESKELHRWPGAWDRAFCAAVGDDSLLKCRVEAAGYKVIDSIEADLLDLGREMLRQKRAAENAAMLERRLAGVVL